MITKSNSPTNHSLFITVTLLVLLLLAIIAFAGNGISLIGKASAADHTLNYSIDHSQLPQMNYYNLTYNIYVGSVSSVEVRNGSNNLLASSYNVSTGMVTVTTDETTLKVTTSGFIGSTDKIGQITLAPLKDNKLWAWSHGFDDNAGFLKAIYEFEKYNVPATLYLNDYSSGVGNVILEPDGKSNPDNPYTWCDDNNSSLDSFTYECHLLLGSKIRQLLNDGWAIGNHTENHTCWSSDATRPSDAELWQGITNVQTKLYNKIVAQSNRTDYKINSFAAPCFNDFNPLIQEKIAAGQTDIIMSEGGFIDYSSPDGFSGASNALPLALGYDFTQAVIRDNRIEGNMNNDSDDAESLAFTKQMFDWLHNNSAQGSAITYWYNTISHSRNEDVFAQAIPYLINTYGSNSAHDEVWVATAEEIYAYTYTKEKAVVSLLCSSTIGDCNSNPVVIPVAEPGPNQILGRVFNDANQNGIDDNEPGVENARLLYWTDSNCDGQTEAYGGDTRSTSTGSYLFDGLDSSICYVVQFDPDSVSDVVVTSMNIGTNDSIDSDFYPNGYTDEIHLPTTAVNLGLHGASLPTPTTQPVNTPTPTNTPTPFPTATPLPNGLAASPLLDNDTVSSEYSEQSYGADVSIESNSFQVEYQSDFGGFKIVKNAPALENVVALTFDVYDASPFAQINLVWIDENFAAISDVQLDVNLCPGPYVISDNIPPAVGGFVFQESSANNQTSSHHSYKIKNVQLIVNQDLSTSPTIPTSIPQCEVFKIFLPLNAR